MWTNEQHAIIHKTSGNTVVYASPGSGKTTVLTEHIVHQLQANAVAPSAVMMITFTRNSARHMRERMTRVAGLSPRAVAALRIGTFHAEMFRMLLQAKMPVYPILGQTEQHKLLLRAMDKAGVRENRGAERVEQSLAQYRAKRSADGFSGPYQRVFQAYEKLKRKQNRWDFDDIVASLCDNMDTVFTSVPPIQYLLVDEFQDTNDVQWSFVTSILEKWGGRLLVVGDDDQSIYAFRGASPSWLMNTPRVLPGTRAYELSMNFRSDYAIVNAASSVISHNKVRIDKSFSVASDNAGYTEGTIVKNEMKESRLLALRLTSIANENAEWSIAVLARTRQQLYASWALCSAQSLPNVEWATFHASKGREWDAVFIIGAIDDNPYLRETPADDEEERRLFYVAMTRAKHHLCIIAPERTEFGTAAPSRYLFESHIVRRI